MTDDDRDDGDERLLTVSAFLLGTQPGTLGGMVRQVGTETEVKLSPNARHYTTAAVLLARHLIAEVDRQSDVPEVDDDLPADAAAYLKLLVESGPVEAGRQEVARRFLLNRSLATWVGDGMFAATDRGRALLGVPAGGVSLAELEESE